MRWLSRYMSAAINMYNEICEYTPPVWCKQLISSPNIKVKLAMTPTPIHQWKLPGLPENITLHIKRDDMTGSVLSGNKVRKLEFLLADALQKGCGSIITCGSLQSNHCRAAAAAAAQLGLKSHLILRSAEDISNIGSTGNLLLSRLCDASIYLVPKRASYETELKPRQLALAEEILCNTGKPAYCIGVGGSDNIGLYGYLNAWEEIIQQDILNHIDDVIVACGSGGTVAGLAIANYLTGSTVKVHGVAVCDNAKYFLDHIDSMMEEIGIDSVRASDIADIIDGYKGAGYGTSTREDHVLYRNIAANTGIYCDPVYSGKAVKGLLGEIKTNPKRFKGKRLLYIHTGGIFGMADGKMNSLFIEEEKVFDWRDDEKSAADFFR